MLTPSKEDPNRDKELERMKKRPQDFGGMRHIPHDWRPNVPLRTNDKTESKGNKKGG